MATFRRLLAVIGRAAYAIYSILGITAVLYFPIIKRNATKVSAVALYSVRKFSFGKVYTAFVGNLLYRVWHKMIPCAVLLESFINFETLIYKRRTLRLSTNLRPVHSVHGTYGLYGQLPVRPVRTGGVNGTPVHDIITHDFSMKNTE